MFNDCLLFIRAKINSYQLSSYNFVECITSYFIFEEIYADLVKICNILISFGHIKTFNRLN